MDKPWEFDRDRAVLLVIDMQNDFVQEGAVMQVKEARNQVPRIQALIAACRECDVPVLYTVHMTDSTYCPGEIAAFPWLADAGMREGSNGAEVIDELRPEPQDIVIRKRRFSAFYQTDLEIILRNIRGTERPVNTVIICGTVTNICCESTARDAFFRDYKVVFGTDVCSANTIEAHRATVENMKIFGRPMDSSSIIEVLEKGVG